MYSITNNLPSRPKMAESKLPHSLTRCNDATASEVCQDSDGGAARRRIATWLGAVLILVAAAFASPVSAKQLVFVPDSTPEISDPLEPVNRAVFAFNRRFKSHIVQPVIEWNRENLPAHFRAGLVGVLRNLAEPQTIIASLLQGEVRQAVRVTKRFAVNTLVGWGGAKDVAAAQSLTREHEDLRSVLCSYGLPEGPYLVLPVIGGSILRDQVGMIGGLVGTFYLLGDLYLPYRLATESVRLFDDQPPVQYLRDGEMDLYAHARALDLERARARC